MPTESQPMRVLLVASRYLPYTGGLETHVYEVGRRLARAGIAVTVLTTDLSGQLPTFERSEGVEIRRVRAWPSNKDYYFAPGIYRVITQGHWDLVHCQGYHNLVPPLAMLAARRANIPYIVTFHSGGHSSRLRNALRRPQWMLLRPLLSGAQKLVAVTEFEAEFFRERLKLPAEQFTVIPNGAQLDYIPKSREEVTGKTDQGPLIVTIGRLERYKGHQRVIKALPMVREQFPGARIRIVGAGPYEAALRKMASQLDVTEYVEIAAVTTEDRGSMAEILAHANLVTLLSEYESQGIAVMEALALQRPVLVADTSALRQFVDRDLVRAIPLKSSPKEVATAVISQLSQPLVPMKVEWPTWDDCAANLLVLYRAVMRSSA